jgi:hypothetical protein
VPEDMEQDNEWDITSYLEEGCMPLGFVVAVKYLNADGEVSLLTGASSEISHWERLGMHLTAVEDVKRTLNTPEEADYDD